MRINNIQNNQSFKGLWGAKVYYSPYKGVMELRRVDRFYPFKDDSDNVINKEIAEGRKNGVSNEKGDLMTMEESVRIERPLPFTRAEFVSYKDKNKGRLIDLSRSDLEIEDYLNGKVTSGLSMHKNEYED